jgi:subtilisin family serine protease
VSDVKRLLATAATATLFLSLPVASMARADQDESEGSYIVVMRSSDDLAGEEAVISRSGGRTEQRFSHAINALSVRVKHSDASRLRNDPNVLSVELDQPMYALDSQSPTPSWGLDRIDQRSLPLNSTFTASAKGAGVDAYIVDTGIYATHSEFTGRLSAGFTAIADGNGTNDCNGHGTHVAGTTAGTTYGIAKSATLIPVRVLSCTGTGSTSGVIAGLDWIVANHVAGKPAVANLSLGGSPTTALDTAVQNVINDGVVMAVAAGNDGLNACNYSPARAVNAITVGATGAFYTGETTDSRSGYSNFGTCLDIFAPGSNIVSSWMGSTTATNTISGTSMATPHVAGVAAVLFGRYPTSTPAQIAAMLRTSATPNVVSAAGTGSPNYLLYLDPLGGAIIAPPPPTPVAPSAPTIVSVTPGNTSLSIAFTAGSAGSSAITTYQYSFNGGASWLPRQAGTTASPIAITGLVNGTTYSVSIRAVSLDGNGTATAPVSATIPTAPATPVIGSATANAGRSATVRWTLGSNGGSAITSHVVTAYLNGSGTAAKTVTVNGATSVTASVTGLTTGGSYTFKVQARNAFGNSALTSASNAIIALR